MYPTIFANTPYAIDTWSLVTEVSIVVIAIAAVILKPRDLPVSKLGILCLTFILAMTGIFGGKIFFLCISKNYFHRVLHFSTINAYIMSIPDFYGALFAEILAMLAFVKLRPKRISFLQLADYAIPFIILQLSMKRIGCLLKGCCYGTTTNLPWGIYFGNAGVAHHPWQLYEFIYALAIFFVLVHLYRKNLSRGIVFFGALFIYGMARFFSDFLRHETIRAPGGLTYQQYVSLIAFVAAATGLLIVARKNKLESLKKG
jgi:phosphatidylglycerol:prolipoprotein diacylglycerol transferase